MFIDGDQNGVIRQHYRATSLTLAAIRSRFPEAPLPASVAEDGDADPERRFDVLEAVIQQASGYAYKALLRQPIGEGGEDVFLSQGTFEQPPFVTFRWIKGAGELYGRSPVMTALPDIKTDNKVVELTLKNASIAVTGIFTLVLPRVTPA